MSIRTQKVSVSEVDSELLLIFGGFAMLGSTWLGFGAVTACYAAIGATAILLSWRIRRRLTASRRSRTANAFSLVLLAVALLYLVPLTVVFVDEWILKTDWFVNEAPGWWPKFFRIYYPYYRHPPRFYLWP